ncbi:amidohydrolase family protein [Bradyrhizobium sp. B097]|uniref:amidohydrolase family protein n=1 Tax=Bradyrhizobium sp. B097 TaxID=3140244 RepID=UPI0031841A72
MTEHLGARRRLIDYASKPPLPQSNPSATHLQNYDLVYGRTPTEEASTLEQFLSTYDTLGFEHVVVKARDIETTFGIKIRNEDVAEFCAVHGPRYIGFAGVDPHKGMQAVRELERAVKELGLRGLNLQCFEHKLPINDKLMYPLYAKCVELDIPVNIHCGINFSRQATMAYGQPFLLDEVLMHFPDLRVCAAPPGWPWVEELLGVAWKHPTLFIGLVMVKPKLLAVANSGYESLLQYGRTVLKDRIIFGSGFPRLSPGQAVREVDELSMPDEIKDLWLYQNAKRFLRL